MIHISGGHGIRYEDTQKGAEYHQFNPPRRPEEYLGQVGPHNNLALPWDVIQAMGKARATREPHGYLVLGEYVRRDGVRFLDIAVDRAWVTSVESYQLTGGHLRYVCPGCGRMSGAHNKGCDQR